MKKSLFFLVVLLLATLSNWAQPVPGNPVTTISTITVNQETSTVDIYVTVEDFTAVGNISYVLVYQNAEINSPSVIGLNSEIDNWGTFEANVSVTDTITISAYDPNTEDPITGVTLEDGDELFILRFTIGTISDFADITFFENSEGTSCEIGGIGPGYTPFIDTPQNTYYIAGGVELIDLDPGSVGSGQYICDGDDPAAFTSIADASGEGDISYQWQTSTTGLAQDFIDIEGAVSSVYDAGNLTVDTWFRRKATALLDGVTQVKYSNNILVTVINFNPEYISIDQTLCEGGDPAQLNGNLSSGDGFFTYQWQQSTTGETEGFSDIEGATSRHYDPGVLSVDTWFRRATNAALGGTNCVEYSNVVKITIINFDPGTIQGDMTFCSGTAAAPFTSTSDASGDGALTYQWQSSTTSGTEGFSNIEGATASTYDAGTLTADTWYRRMATATLNGTSCDEFSNVLSITVINLAPGTIGTDQYISEGADAAVLTSETDAVGDGTVTYQWEMSTTSGTEGFSDIEDATSSTYDPPALTADAWYRREATATIDVTSCSDYSNVIAVVVVNFNPGVISDDQVTCQDEPAFAFSSESAASGDGTLTYQWQSSTTSGTEGFSDIEGATSATYNPGSLGVDTWFRREAIAAMGGNEFSEYSNVVAVTVIGVTPGAIDNPQTICSGDDPAALTSTTPASGEGTLAYQWQSSTTSATEGFADITDAIAETYDPGVTTVDTWFRRQASTTLLETECVKYSNVVKITANPLRTISGVFYYYHSSGNILLTGQDITVKLYKTSDATHETLLATVVTDENGYYEFTGLCPDCDYDIVATSTGSNTGAINTTDAAQINYWGAHPSTIEKIRFYAGDIGNGGNCQDLTINSTDAGRIQQYFVYGTAIDRKWTFWTTGTTISSNPACESFPSVHLAVGSNLTQNMYGLCTGDFNRSFNPVMTKAASSSLQLVNTGNRQISSEQEFDLPVRMVNASTVGAISLILNFPSEQVEIKDVTMPGAGGQLDWAVKGNELRIGWNAPTPLYLTDNAEFITLKLKTAAGFTNSTPVVITLANDPLNELADAWYDVIGNAVIGIDAINGNALGINDPGNIADLSLGNYPNPYHDATSISYNLPENGIVTLEVTNLLGSRSNPVVNEMQTAGFHEFKLNTTALAPGIYTVTLRFQSGKDILVKTIKTLKN